ncbi:MAG: hypothetical protein Kow0074_21250 [Candidatus Zixiibacteriota bacterium]
MIARKTSDSTTAYHWGRSSEPGTRESIWVAWTWGLPKIPIKVRVGHGSQPCPTRRTGRPCRTRVDWGHGTRWMTDIRSVIKANLVDRHRLKKLIEILRLVDVVDCFDHAILL